MKWATLTCLILTATGSALGTGATNAPDIWRDFPWPATATGTPVLVDCLALVATNEWSLALSKIEAQLIDHPQDAGALHLSGLLFWHSGNREESTRRLLLAIRAPESQAVTMWALAALSGQARSQAEAVGWIKRASRGAEVESLRQWLRKPYFTNLCEYPPYRELLAELELSSLCPFADNDVSGRIKSLEDATRELLRGEGPQPSLRLPVQDARMPQVSLEEKATPNFTPP